MKWTIKILINAFLTLIVSNDLLSQNNSIGFTFLDKNLNKGSCKFCFDRDPLSEKQIDFFEKNSPIKSVDEISLNHKDLYVNYIDSTLRDSKLTKLTLGYLKFQKIGMLSNFVNFTDSAIFTQLKSKGETILLPSPKLALEIDSLFDEILSLDLDIESLNYVRKTRMECFLKIGLISIFEHFSPDFCIDKDTSAFEDLNFKSLATKYLNDEQLTNYIPFRDYVGMNTGFSSCYGRTWMVGIDFSLEYATDRNPFSNFARVDLIGFNYHLNTQEKRKEFLFNILNLKQIGFATANIIQFGIQGGYDANWYWAYRPQLGYAYGPFMIGYAYNYTFNKNVRALMPTHLLTLNISYPFIRLGRYF